MRRRKISIGPSYVIEAPPCQQWGEAIAYEVLHRGKRLGSIHQAHGLMALPLHQWCRSAGINEDDALKAIGLACADMGVPAPRS